MRRHNAAAVDSTGGDQGHRKGLQGRAHPNLQVVLYPCSHIIAGAPGHDEPVISPDQVFSVCSGINQQQCSANIPVAVPCTHNGHAGSANGAHRSEEHTSELQSLMRISYAVFCLKKKTTTQTQSK